MQKLFAHYWMNHKATYCCCLTPHSFTSFRGPSSTVWQMYCVYLHACTTFTCDCGSLFHWGPQQQQQKKIMETGVDKLLRGVNPSKASARDDIPNHVLNCVLITLHQSWQALFSSHLTQVNYHRTEEKQTFLVSSRSVTTRTQELDQYLWHLWYQSCWYT